MFKVSGRVLVIIMLAGSLAANAEVGVVAHANDAQVAHAPPNAAMMTGGIVLHEHVYVIRPASSKMAFRVDSPIGDVWASFEDFEGVFTILDNGGHGGFAAIEIDAASLDTDAGLIGAMLKSPRFFDVVNFPSMRFVGTSLEWYGRRRAVLKGDMTIKNVTRQVAFYLELVDVDQPNGHSERITVEASTTIRRSEFGIDGLLPAVGDNVNLFMSIAAVKDRTSLSMR